MATSKTQPVESSTLEKITTRACQAALSPATSYDHTQTEAWNATIINTILQGLLEAATAVASSDAKDQPQYKYAVNSTIIQHLGTSTSTGSGPNGSTTTALGAAEASAEDVAQNPVAGTAADETNGAQVVPRAGRRGMHSATGAFWNAETDGMWSYKYTGGESKGMDVVVSIIWMSV